MAAKTPPASKALPALVAPFVPAGTAVAPLESVDATAMNQTPSHLDLLTRARTLRRAAIDGDLTRTHDELSQLRNALVHHLHAEQDRVARLREATARVVRDGQHRVLALLDDLLFDTETLDGSCNCVVRATEVELMMRRQAKLEAAVFEDPVVAATRQP